MVQPLWRASGYHPAKWCMHLPVAVIIPPLAINPKRYKKTFAQRICCSTIGNSKRLKRTHMFTLRGWRVNQGMITGQSRKQLKKANSTPWTLTGASEYDFPLKDIGLLRKNGSFWVWSNKCARWAWTHCHSREKESYQRVRSKGHKIPLAKDGTKEYQ